jgi:type I restriction enzyme, S subunit
VSWPKVKLGDIFEIARGGSPRPIKDYITDAEDGLNWISIKDASNSTKYITKTKLKIRKEGLSKSRLVKPGDFLLTNSMSFGRPYIMGTTGCIHDGWLVLSSDKEVVNSDYFFQLFSSDLIYRKFSELSAGAVVKNLNIDIVKSVEISLPPLCEQKRIAAILDKADGIRNKRQQAIDLADQFLRSVFLDMFGDPYHDAAKYEVVPFEDLTSRITYGFTSPMQHVESNIPILTAKNVKHGYLDISKCHYALREEFEALTAKSKPVKGDLLITKDGTIGRCAIFEEDYEICINQSVALIQPRHDIVNPVYLEAYVNNSTVQSILNGMGKGNALKHLQITELAKLPIPYPPMAAQEEYAELSQRTKGLIRNLDRSIEDNNDLFHSLSQLAFTESLEKAA